MDEKEDGMEAGPMDLAAGVSRSSFTSGEKDLLCPFFPLCSSAAFAFLGHAAARAAVLGIIRVMHSHPFPSPSIGRPAVVIYGW
jgi:hypothetical protein